MPNTPDKNERRLTQPEISVIRVCCQLLKTVEYNEYLSREQILKRVNEAYEDLLENYFSADEFLEANFHRWESLREEQIKEYYITHKMPRKKIQRE